MHIGQKVTRSYIDNIIDLCLPSAYRYMIYLQLQQISFLLIFIINLTAGILVTAMSQFMEQLFKIEAAELINWRTDCCIFVWRLKIIKANIWTVKRKTGEVERYLREWTWNRKSRSKMPWAVNGAAEAETCGRIDVSSRFLSSVSSVRRMSFSNYKQW